MKEQTNKLRKKEMTNQHEIKTADRDQWGYVICFGTILTFVAGIGHVNSFGLIYNDFMNDTKSTAKSLTTAHGVFAIMLAIGGIILNIITKQYSLRTGGLIGSALFVSGSFATILIRNTNQLPYTFGVLQGIGFGMMTSVCYATINYYFVQKRTTVIGVCKALQGIAQMIYPHLIKLIMNIYGFRGTLLILSGISLNTVAGMVFMKKWKPIDKTLTRIAKNVEDGRGMEKDELLDTNKDQILNPIGNDNHHRSNTVKVIYKIINILNFKVLKDVHYCNICIGQSFMNFSDLTFFILQPLLLFQYGFNKSQVAICISIGAGADVIGRIALAVLSSILPINIRLLYYITASLTFVTRIALIQVRHFVWVALVTALLGILRSGLHVASPLVIANHVSHEDFPGAYALFMLAAGLINVFFGPLIGFLKDIYTDYIPAFYAITLCCVPCIILWPIEYKYLNKS